MNFRIGDWVFDHELETFDYIGKPYSPKNPYWIGLDQVLLWRHISWPDHLSRKNWGDTTVVKNFEDLVAKVCEQRKVKNPVVKNG